MSGDDRTNSKPGVMGDGTEEQNLGRTGDPKARITKDEVDEAFGKTPSEPQHGTGGKTVEPGGKA